MKQIITEYWENVDGHINPKTGVCAVIKGEYSRKCRLVISENCPEDAVIEFCKRAKKMNG